MPPTRHTDSTANNGDQDDNLLSLPRKGTQQANLPEQAPVISTVPCCSRRLHPSASTLPADAVLRRTPCGSPAVSAGVQGETFALGLLLLPASDWTLDD